MFWPHIPTGFYRRRLPCLCHSLLDFTIQFMAVHRVILILPQSFKLNLLFLDGFWRLPPQRNYRLPKRLPEIKKIPWLNIRLSKLSFGCKLVTEYGLVLRSPTSFYFPNIYRIWIFRNYFIFRLSIYHRFRLGCKQTQNSSPPEV